MNWIRRIFIVSAVFVVGGMASLINVHAETYGDYEYEINADGKTVTITKYMKEDEYDPETGWTIVDNNPLYIPASIEGRKVTIIGEESFKGILGNSNIVIPNGVEQIGLSAFEGMYNLTSVSLPNTLKVIGQTAFFDCMDLSVITLPDSLEEIGDNAFGYTNISSVWIPENVRKLNGSVFEKSTPEEFGSSNLIPVTVSVSSKNKFLDSRDNCNGIIETATGTLLWGNSKTVIPSGVKIIGEYAFSGAEFKQFVVPSNVTEIGRGAFSGCSYLEQIYMSDNVISIGDSAFTRCSLLTYISFSKNIKNLGEYAFSECSSLSEITLPDSITSLGCSVFEWCENLQRIYLPENITVLPDYMFVSCHNITEINIPSKVTTIGECAFGFCVKLNKIVLPDSLKKIGKEAFEETDITAITIPRNVQDIGTGIVADCDKLTKIVVNSGNKYYDSRNNCNAIIDKEEKTLIAGCRSTIIPSDIKIIGEYAFYYCEGLSSITIPENIESIYDNAFGYCINLKKIVIKSKDTYLYDYTFSECNNDLVIFCYENSEALFYAKSNGLNYSIMKIEKIDLGKTTSKTRVTGIVNKVYNGKMQTQPGLIVKVNGKKLVLNKDYSVRYLNNKNIGHASITITGKGNYSGSLTKKFDIMLPVGKTISVGNLKYRVTNASINGKGQVSVIGSTYKKNSRKLKTVNIGSSIVVGNMKYNITSIEKNAFKGCKYLSSVNIGSGVKVIGASAFEKCVRLNKVTIKTMYLKSVGKKAFSSIYKKAVFKLPRKEYGVYVKMIKKTRVSNKVVFKRV